VYLIIYSAPSAGGHIAEAAILAHPQALDGIQEVECVRSNRTQFRNALSPFG